MLLPKTPRHLRPNLFATSISRPAVYWPYSMDDVAITARSGALARDGCWNWGRINGANNNVTQRGSVAGTICPSVSIRSRRMHRTILKCCRDALKGGGSRLSYKDDSRRWQRVLSVTPVLTVYTRETMTCHGAADRAFFGVTTCLYNSSEIDPWANLVLTECASLIEFGMK